MEYIDCVALGTICDTMALVGLNRAFVATGLKVLNLRQNLGLRVLMDVAGVDKVSVYTAGFVIGPRLNAAGRLDSASPALDLLLTDNPLIAYDLANKLNAKNHLIDPKPNVPKIHRNRVLYQPAKKIPPPPHVHHLRI